MTRAYSSIQSLLFGKAGILSGVMTIGVMLSIPLFAHGQARQTEPAVPEADSAPKSILFPSGVPGPYFPSDSEIAETAESRLDQPSGQSILNEDMDQITSPGTDVDVIDLAGQDQSAYGILTRSNGGLSRIIWQPSTYENIEKLFKVLQLPSKSPAMNTISKKLLLSAALPPTGVTIILNPENQQSAPEEELIDPDLVKRFINLRISKLIEQGNLDDMVKFIQNLPEGTLEPSQQNAEILMLGGDIIGACEMTMNARSEQENQRQNSFSNQGAMTDQERSDDLFWLKMLAFCRTLEGDNTGAQIALDMMTERGQEDFIYFDLLNKLMENPDTRSVFLSGGLSSLDPLKYTILSLLDQPIDANLIEDSSPLILSALVINPNMSADNRFQAAVRSYQSGGVSADVLRNIYGLQEFSEREYNNAEQLAQFDDRPMMDALLYQTASRQADDAAKTAILNVIWQRAAEKNDLPRASELNIKTLMSLNPSTDLIGQAYQITRGLILGGEIEKAKEWYDFTRRAASTGNSEATTALIKTWPLVILAANRGEIAWSEDILDLWWNGQSLLSPENRDSKATLFYALAEAFQFEVPDNKWQELVAYRHDDNTHSIPLAVWRDMIRSVAENKQGQAIILSLIAMGADGPGSLDASGISVVVRLLRSFGLEHQARMVAIEALVAHDF